MERIRTGEDRCGSEGTREDGHDVVLVRVPLRGVVLAVLVIAEIIYRIQIVVIVIPIWIRGRDITIGFAHITDSILIRIGLAAVGSGGTVVAHIGDAIRIDVLILGGGGVIVILISHVVRRQLKCFGGWGIDHTKLPRIEGFRGDIIGRTAIRIRHTGIVGTIGPVVLGSVSAAG